MCVAFILVVCFCSELIVFYKCNIRGVIYALNESGCIEDLNEKFL